MTGYLVVCHLCGSVVFGIGVLALVFMAWFRKLGCKAAFAIAVVVDLLPFVLIFAQKFELIALGVIWGLADVFLIPVAGFLSGFREVRTRRALIWVMTVVLLATLFVGPYVAGAEQSADPVNKPKFEGGSKFPVSPEDLKHGDRQLERMLKDRPAMWHCVAKGDALWVWTVRQFAGENFGKRVYWDAAAPDVPGTGTNHYYAARPCIRVAATSEGKPMDSEMLWCAAVFELYNIANGREYDALWRKARSGRLDREQWVNANCRLEYKCVLRGKAFYYAIWKPQAKARGFMSRQDYWRIEASDHFETWLAGEDGQQFVRYWRGAFMRGRVVSDYPIGH